MKAILAGVLLYLIPVIALEAQQQDPVLQFESDSLSLQQVKILQQSALESDKDLLIILGGEWCHDSVALIEQFSTPEFSQKISQQYEVAVVNVGYLNNGFDIVEHYQLPTYFGTPTVLIVDSETGEIENRLDFHQWTNAASMQPAAYQQYFIEREYHQLDMDSLDPQQRTQILAYEKTQAQRVKDAYEIAGPLLEAYKKSGNPPNATFREVWYELADFRNQIPTRVTHAMLQNDSSVLTVLPPLSWERGEFQPESGR